MKKIFPSVLVVFGILFSSCGQSQQPEKTSSVNSNPQRQIGGDCEDCDLMYQGMPENINWETSIAPNDEPGEKMIISGTIYMNDGKTRAPGVVLYVYHTDAKGIYSKSKDQPGNMHHGHLRGWMKTNEKGQYKFTSIRPASYPGGRDAAHIHPLIKEPGKNEYRIDEYLFDDDPLVNLQQERYKPDNRGGNGVIRLKKNAEGIWIGHRDIILGLNVPDYY